MISAPETRLAVSAEEAARLLDISRRSFINLRLPSIPVCGRLTRYRISTLQEYLDRQEEKASAERDLARRR